MFIPLVMEKPGSDAAGRLWYEADHVVSLRLIYPEARAALGQAERIDRVSPHVQPVLVEDVESLYLQLDRMDIDEALVRRAGDLAQQFGLRGYDAVHLAGAERLNDPQVVLVAGDGDLRDAATDLGLAVAGSG